MLPESTSNSLIIVVHLPLLCHLYFSSKPSQTIEDTVDLIVGRVIYPALIGCPQLEVRFDRLGLGLIKLNQNKSSDGNMEVKIPPLF